MSSTNPTSTTRKEETHWDEDQRRALAHSHLRTMQELEEGHLDDHPDPLPTAKDPGTNILPIDFAEKEQVAKKRTYSSDDEGEKPAVSPFKRLWGTEEVSLKKDKEFNKHGSGWSRNTQCFVGTMLILAITSLVTVLIIPSTREAMTMSVSNLLQETEAIVANNNEKQVFSGRGMTSIFGDNIKLKVDGLYSPNNYPIINTIPVLWLVPQSGSDVVLNVLQYCLRLTIASGLGAHDQERNSLAVLTHPDNVAHFLNVDMSTLEGIERANHLSLVESGLADIIATPLPFEVAELFSTKRNTGRLVCILEHPVIRAVAQYHQHNSVTTTLVQYAESVSLEENVLTRVLANVTLGAVTIEHLNMAKFMVEQFLVVGLADRMDETLEYLYGYFGWPLESDLTCQTNFVKHRSVSFIDPKSDEYSTLADRNWADMDLYDYARELFERRAKRGRLSWG